MTLLMCVTKMNWNLHITKWWTITNSTHYIHAFSSKKIQPKKSQDTAKFDRYLILLGQWFYLGKGWQLFIQEATADRRRAARLLGRWRKTSPLLHVHGPEYMPHTFLTCCSERRNSTPSWHIHCSNHEMASMSYIMSKIANYMQKNKGKKKYNFKTN